MVGMFYFTIYSKSELNGLHVCIIKLYSIPSLVEYFYVNIEYNSALYCFMISSRHGIWERWETWIVNSICFCSEKVFEYCFEDRVGKVLSIKQGVWVYDVLMLGDMEFVLLLNTRWMLLRENTRTHTYTHHTNTHTSQTNHIFVVFGYFSLFPVSSAALLIILPSERMAGHVISSSVQSMQTPTSPSLYTKSFWKP